MAYNKGIPQEDDNPSQSQGLIEANFQEINTAFNLNHGNFNDPDQGKHKFLDLPDQSSPPTTGANEGAFYSQNSTLTGTTELVFRRESNGDEIEFTGFLGADDGWTRLPSGILLKWGTGNGSGISSTSFPIGANIPVFTAVFSAQVTVKDTSSEPNSFATFRTVSITAISTFGSSRVSKSETDATFTYLVIGI